MLVNLSFNTKFVESHFAQHPKYKILDISGTAAHLAEDSDRVISLRHIEGFNRVELRSIDNYIDFISRLSLLSANNKSIRELQFEGLPILWILPIMEKHDSYHWGQLVFLYFECLHDEEFGGFFENRDAKILLDNNSVFLQDFIRENSKIDSFRIDEFLCSQVSSNDSYSSSQFIKNSFKLIGSLLYRRRKKTLLSLRFIIGLHF